MGDLLKRIVIGIRDIFWGTAAPDVVTALSPGSPSQRADIANAAKGFYEVVTAPIQAKMDELNATHSPMTPEESVAWTTAFAGVGVAGLGLGAAGSFLSELATLGQVESISEWLKSVWVEAGFAAMVGTPIATMYNSALRIPFNYWTLGKFQPMIPGISDQVRFAVREAYPGVTIDNTPAEMEKWVKYQGYSKFWSDSFWNAHWIIPSVSQLFQMRWRGLIDDVELKKMLKINDIMPEWIEKIMKITYNVPRLVDIRTAFEYGGLTEEEFRVNLLKRGYDPVDIEWVIEASKATMLRDEIGRVRTIMINLFKEGFWTEAKLRTELAAFGYRKEIIDYNVIEGKLKLEMDQKTEYLTIYTTLLTKEKITVDEFIALCRGLGLSEDAIVRKVDLFTAKAKVL